METIDTELARIVLRAQFQKEVRDSGPLTRYEKLQILATLASKLGLRMETKALIKVPSVSHEQLEHVDVILGES